MKLPSSAPQTNMASLSAAELTDIYLDMRPQLERIIASRVGSRTVAADLAQEIFFKISNIAARLPTRQDAERYFQRVAVNASNDYFTVERRRREILYESRSVFERNAPSPEMDAVSRDEVKRIEAIVNELPDMWRQMLVMSRFEGLSHAEIAQKLGVSRSLIEKYIVRALRMCREKLSRDT